MILECLFKRPEIEFECIIDGLTSKKNMIEKIDIDNKIKNISDDDIKIKNISDDDINLH